MKKEYLLMFGSIVASLSVALGLIRWVAPNLLGLPNDLQLVQIDEKVPPFYEGVFRREDLQSSDFLLQDPLTRVRAKPFYPELGGMGPHDVLGFRNRNVPNVTDIIAIGDSQTYGNNAMLGDTWPNQMEALLSEKQARVYTMAVGGWGAVQYLDMFTNATVFKPRVVVIAFYTGNDPLDTFTLVHGSKIWRHLIVNRSLTKTDAPQVAFPAPQSQWWPVKFKDGVATTFTPTLRLTSNRDHPAVHEGYAIMANVARRIVELSKPIGIQAVFTIVPTKELVYSRKVQEDGLKPPDDYSVLIEDETRNIEQLAKSIRHIDGAHYVDLVEPLQKSAKSSTPLYPGNINGHPVAAGYRIIARAISQHVIRLLPQRHQGLYAVQIYSDSYQYSLIKNNRRWIFADLELIGENGWANSPIDQVTLADVAQIPLVGVITKAEPARFGPESF